MNIYCMHAQGTEYRVGYSTDVDCKSSIKDGVIIACLESCCYGNRCIIKISES